MKIDITIKALLLILILGLSSIETDCRKTRMSKKLLTSKTRFQAQTKGLEFVWKFLKEKLTNPLDLLYFVLGVLSEFAKFFETLYKNITPVVDKYKACAESATELLKEVTDKLEEKDNETDFIEKDANIIKFLSELKDESAQKDYCEKVKKQNDSVYDQAKFKKADRGFDFFGICRIFFKNDVAKQFSSNTEYCKQIFCLEEKKQKEIAKDYGSLEDYVQQCIYFRELNCSKFTAENGILNFLKKAYKYKKLVDNVKECLVKEIEKDEKSGKEFKKGSILHLAAQTLGVVANIFTLGKWGGIKGGYNLIQLAIDLKQNYDDTVKDLAFKIGKLIGKALLIAKSVLFFSRKFRTKRLK